MYEELITNLRNCAETNSLSRYKRDLMKKAANAIEELLQKEKFHAFLWNVINPNDMQLYLEMYHSGDEKQEATE